MDIIGNKECECEVYILASYDLTDKKRKLLELKRRCQEQHLFAICYAVRGPRQSDYVEDLDTGLFTAKTGEEYRRKVNAYKGDALEAAFVFYTIYGRQFSSARYETDEEFLSRTDALS